MWIVPYTLVLFLPQQRRHLRQKVKKQVPCFPSQTKLQLFKSYQIFMPGMDLELDQSGHSGTMLSTCLALGVFFGKFEVSNK
jgi:hypothetical protein